MVFELRSNFDSFILDSPRVYRIHNKVNMSAVYVIQSAETLKRFQYSITDFRYLILLDNLTD